MSNEPEKPAESVVSQEESTTQSTDLVGNRPPTEAEKQYGLSLQERAEQLLSQPNLGPCQYCYEPAFRTCLIETCLTKVCKEHVSGTNINLCTICAGDSTERDVGKCLVAGCSTMSGQACLICHRKFCKEHASRRDKWMCSECSADQLPIPEMSVDVEIRPLIDFEGVTHKGKHIVPISSTHVAYSYIDGLSDTELTEYANELKAEIKNAEKLMYGKLIVLGHVEGVTSDRDKAKKRKSRLENTGKVFSSKQMTVPGQAGPPKREAAPTVTEIKQGMTNLAKSLSPEMKAKMLEVLKKMKEK